MKATTTPATMLSPPLSDSQMGLRPRTKSGRKPLQTIIKNTTTTTTRSQAMKPIPDPSKKENFINFDVKIINIEPFEASLAEELSSIRKKMERLKLDKDETESLLKERDLMLHREMNEVLIRGEAQKQIEIQVDRLFRLKEMRCSCMKKSPFQSLREKEVEKKIKEEIQEKKINVDDIKSDIITIEDQNASMERPDDGDCK